MRSAVVVFVLLGVGCGGDGERVHRWPTHRTDKDKRLDELGVLVEKQAKEIVTLEDRVKLLESRIAQPPTPPPSPETP